MSDILSHRFLQTAGFIIFLNKQDKLREKIVVEKKSIADAYPDYSKYKLETKGKLPTALICYEIRVLCSFYMLY